MARVLKLTQLPSSKRFLARAEVEIQGVVISPVFLRRGENGPAGIHVQPVPEGVLPLTTSVLSLRPPALYEIESAMLSAYLGPEEAGAFQILEATRRFAEVEELAKKGASELSARLRDPELPSMERLRLIEACSLLPDSAVAWRALRDLLQDPDLDTRECALWALLPHLTECDEAFRAVQALSRGDDHISWVARQLIEQVSMGRIET